MSYSRRLIKEIAHIIFLWKEGEASCKGLPFSFYIWYSESQLKTATGFLSCPDDGKHWEEETTSECLANIPFHTAIKFTWANHVFFSFFLVLVPVPNSQQRRVLSSSRTILLFAGTLYFAFNNISLNFHIFTLVSGDGRWGGTCTPNDFHICISSMYHYHYRFMKEPDTVAWTLAYHTLRAPWNYVSPWRGYWKSDKVSSTRVRITVYI